MKNNKITYGISLIIFGVILTLLTKFIAESIAFLAGGNWYIYIIAFGPIIYGFSLIFDSIEDKINSKKKSKPEDSVYRKFQDIPVPPYNSVLENRRRMIRIKIAVLFIPFIVLITIISKEYKILFIALIPIIYSIMKLVSYNEEIKSDEKNAEYRMKMNELKAEEEKNKTL